MNEWGKGLALHGNLQEGFETCSGVISDLFNHTASWHRDTNLCMFSWFVLAHETWMCGKFKLTLRAWTWAGLYFFSSGKNVLAISTGPAFTFVVDVRGLLWESEGERGWKVLPWQAHSLATLAAMSWGCAVYNQVPCVGPLLCLV